MKWPFRRKLKHRHDYQRIGYGGAGTTEHYDRARGNLDRHGVHFLTAYVAGA